MMNYKDYLKHISFKFIQPDTKLNVRLTLAIVLQFLNRLGLSLETVNSVLPYWHREREEKIGKLSRIPKASSYALGAIINKGVSGLKENEVFLNIGVWHGFTFLSGLIENPNIKCIGVDNFCVNQKVKSDGSPQYHGVRKLFYKFIDIWARRSFKKRFHKYKSEQHHFFEMDYVEYFKKIHKDPIGFYIYDAQHRYVDQLRALQLAEPFFADNCIILIDDTNDEDNRQATLDFMKQSPNEYRLLFDVKTHSNRHPTFWNGVMIFEKRHAKKKTLIDSQNPSGQIKLPIEDSVSEITERHRIIGPDRRVLM